jgi:hypothetical protein
MGGDRAESVLILVLDQVPSANNGLVQRALLVWGQKMRTALHDDVGSCSEHMA